MKIEYSYEDLVIGAKVERKKERKSMFVGMLIIFIPAMIFGMVLLGLVIPDMDDGKYLIEIKPYQELTSPYRPFPTYLGQELPQVWTIKIRNGRQFGIAQFVDFKPQGAPDSMRISLDEYKQILMDQGIYNMYAWGGNHQGSKK